MDTSKLKKFAIEARKSLMGIVSAKLDLVLDVNSFERRNNPQAIKALEGLIAEIGKEQTIEKVAYTWFNRFIALRFMDVNRYTKIGIVSPTEGQTQPEVLSEAKGGYVDKQVVPAEVEQRISGLLNGAISSPKPQEEVYKLLLVAYCNAYNKLMPFMFERIKDYTELLMPDDLLSNGSVLTQTVETLDAETCKDVEVIGWLYQYFNQEEKDRVIKAKKRYKAFEIPYATQLFTPDWIVRYMTQNSLGKLWMETNPTSKLKEKMEFYLEPRNVSDEAKKELLTHIFEGIKPQEIKVFDPACGSGHVLVYAFEIIFEIYKEQGWQQNEIPEMILTNNLFGLDICDRAAQLAQFAVMMKARQYDRNIFNKLNKVNICSVKDTKWITSDVLEDLLEGVNDREYAKQQIFTLCENFNDARIIGSLCKVDGIDVAFWEERLNYFKTQKQTTMNSPAIRGRLPFLIKQLKIMQQNYECVITNPPYMGRKYMEASLTEFVQKEYKDVKSDLFSAFIVYCKNKSIDNGYIGFMTPFVWMFISSYEDLRKIIINDTDITSLVQLEYSGFDGATVPICTFTLAKRNIADMTGCYVRLSDFPGAKNQPIKTREAVMNRDCGFYYETKNNDFNSIPGSPIAYWASDRVRDIFTTSTPLKKIAPPRAGMQTGENELFVRMWQEIENSKMFLNCSSCAESLKLPYKWYPYNNGGEYRKWYGNRWDVVDWYHDGYNIKQDKLNKLAQGLCLPSNSKPKNMDYYFKESITWSFISSANFGVRYSPRGAIFDIAGSSVFASENDIKYLTGFLCSKLAFEYLRILNPTLNFQVGNVSSLPIIFDNSKKTQIDALVEQNIAISKDDWDSFETSWDFEQHPLIRFKTDGKVADSFNAWAEYKEKQFNQLKANEEELNRLFIEIYGLQDEMTPEVDDKDITVAKADEEREIKSLISYAVGCMFGRYSLDAKGLIYAGGDFDANNYQTFEADEDNIIPVLSEHYFTDDIVERFNKFIKIAFGERYYAENMAYIAAVLSTDANRSPDQVLRDYFIKDFYKDHVQMYQKRPIYWMFSSEKNSFNALIYLHRYNKDTVNLVLNDYLREYKNKLQGNINACNTMEKAGKAAMTLNKIALQANLNEADDYERNILFPLATERKEIDLDDGVKVNYLKFGKALRNIGLKEKA
ncbi:MAG: BREX-1 system adenine-specific DNA-methyltransferase PglX [Alphaproteobacteria bacterium]|nr:BREX-1 system adenine-specific DNA-methyltransferase PglX [Alphaproteobacteria bacterium]